MDYAGFWRRFAAYWIDALPIFLIIGALFYFFLGFDETVHTHLRGPRTTESLKNFLSERNKIRDLSFSIYLIYSIIMDSSEYQGTFGKRIMGIKVVDIIGNRLSIPSAIGRNLAKPLSAIFLGLGFMWIGWTKRKQSWHDIMSNSLVVKKSDD